MALDISQYPPKVQELYITWRAQARATKSIGESYNVQMKNLADINSQLYAICMQEGIDMESLKLTEGIIGEQ